MRKHHALARRLLAREDDYLRYTHDPRVPFDNNAAEREVRMSKLRIKVSGSMRSMTGAQAFCAIRSYLSTAAKHGIGIKTQVPSLFDGLDVRESLHLAARRCVRVPIPPVGSIPRLPSRRKSPTWSCS